MGGGRRGGREGAQRVRANSNQGASGCGESVRREGARGGREGDRQVRGLLDRGARGGERGAEGGERGSRGTD